MENFPILKDNEVAIVQCDYSTGIVLDKNFNKVLGEQVNTYIVFSTKEKAIKYIQTVMAQRNDIEFVLYDKNESLPEYYHP